MALPSMAPDFRLWQGQGARGSFYVSVALHDDLRSCLDLCKANELVLVLD
jgi:hypothetical protein